MALSEFLGQFLFEGLCLIEGEDRLLNGAENAEAFGIFVGLSALRSELKRLSFD